MCSFIYAIYVYAFDSEVSSKSYEKTTKSMLILCINSIYFHFD